MDSFPVELVGILDRLAVDCNHRPTDVTDLTSAPTDAAPGELPDPTLLTLLRSVERAVTAEVVTRLRTAGYPGLSATHGKVFPFVGEAGSRVADMARAAGVTKQSMAEFVALLERQGYVERRPDPTDHRAKLVVLTARGRQVVDTGEQALRAARTQIAGAIGADGLAELYRLLLAVELVCRDWPATVSMREHPPGATLDGQAPSH